MAGLFNATPISRCHAQGRRLRSCAWSIVTLALLVCIMGFRFRCADSRHCRILDCGQSLRGENGGDRREQGKSDF